MTFKLETRGVGPRDIDRVASRMRDCDAAEVLAAAGLGPLDALTQSVKVSTYAKSFADEDGAFAIFGVASKNKFSPLGFPWLLGTDRIADHPRWFLRETRTELKALLRHHQFLENWVDARNVTSIKWLEWLGFNIDEPAPYGVEGRLFHHFSLRGNNNVCTTTGSQRGGDRG